MTEDEAVESIVRVLDIKTMKEWRAQVDDDMLRKYGLGLRSDGKDLRPSRIRAAIRRLRKSPNRKRRNRPRKERLYPKY